MSKIKCLLGFHDWLLNCVEIRMGTIRRCRRCGRGEICSYDMGYGETTWRKMEEK